MGHAPRLLRHPSIFMTWANARDAMVLENVSASLQDQAHSIAASGVNQGELQKVKKVRPCDCLAQHGNVRQEEASCRCTPDQSPRWRHQIVAVNSSPSNVFLAKRVPSHPPSAVDLVVYRHPRDLCRRCGWTSWTRWGTTRAWRRP